MLSLSITWTACNASATWAVSGAGGGRTVCASAVQAGGAVSLEGYIVSVSITNTTFQVGTENCALSYPLHLHGLSGRALLMTCIRLCGDLCLLSVP